MSPQNTPLTVAALRRYLSTADPDAVVLLEAPEDETGNDRAFVAASRVTRDTVRAVALTHRSDVLYETILPEEDGPWFNKERAIGVFVLRGKGFTEDEGEGDL